MIRRPPRSTQSRCRQRQMCIRDSLWVIPFGYGDTTNHFLDADLNAHAFKIEDLWFGHIHLTHYSAAPASAERKPLDVVFAQPAGHISLAGYSLAPTSPTPGEVLGVTLYWRPDGPTPIPYKVFVH